MPTGIVKSLTLLAAGFGLGFLFSHLPTAFAAGTSGTSTLSQRQFLVSIDEIRQNFAFGDKFAGHYTRTVTLSDGSKRRIELTPMVHDGMQVVEFKDNRGRSYMGLNGTTTNGKLMVQLRDVDDMNRELKREGWSGTVL